MFALACCNDEGVCIGFLSKTDTLVTDKNKFTDEFLVTFPNKKKANEKVLQINLGHSLLPNGHPFRVTPVRM